MKSEENKEPVKVARIVEEKEESEDYDDWTELGNEINKRYTEMDPVFGVHPILDLIRQTGQFHVTRKQ